MWKLLNVSKLSALTVCQPVTESKLGHFLRARAVSFSICPRKLLFNVYITYSTVYKLVMAATPGSYRCMACGLVFDTEDEAKHHEEQHPGMVRKATGETAPP